MKNEKYTVLFNLMSGKVCWISVFSLLQTVILIQPNLNLIGSAINPTIVKLICWQGTCQTQQSMEMGNCI